MKIFLVRYFVDRKYFVILFERVNQPELSLARIFLVFHKLNDCLWNLQSTWKNGLEKNTFYFVLLSTCNEP